MTLLRGHSLELDDGLDFQRFLHDWTLSSSSLLQSDGSVFSLQSCFSSNVSEVDHSKVSPSTSPEPYTNADTIACGQHPGFAASLRTESTRTRSLQAYTEGTNGKLDAVITVPAAMEQASAEAVVSCMRACESCRVSSAEHKRRRMERRREQNRASQRRFRAGKEAKIREAEEHSKDLQQRLQHMEVQARRLQLENLTLRGKLESLGGIAHGHAHPNTEDTYIDRHLHLSLLDRDLDPGNGSCL